MAKEKFDYNSRNKYWKAVIAQWQENTKDELAKTTEEQRKLMEGINSVGTSNYASFIEADKLWRKYVNELSDGGQASLIDFIKKEFGFAVNIYVPKEYREDYFAILGEFSTFQYSSGWNRRSVRSINPKLHLIHAIRLMYTYMSFATYKVSVSDFIRDNLPEEALDFKRNNTGCYGGISIYNIDDVYAARINAGDMAVIEAIKEAILSENNHVIVTTDMIRAIIKCKNTELHQLLGKFLVAARLSEGLRQAICESMDCGRADAFLTLMDVIKEENLIRFSAVKRAISTWCGLGDPENVDRIIDKVFAEMCAAAKDSEYARSLTETDDTVKIIIGLWAIGFYSIESAINRAYDMVKTASRPQLLAISYFNRSVDDSELKRKVSYKIVTTYPDDLELLAAYMPTYMPEHSGAARMTFHTKNNESAYRNLNVDYIYSELDYKEFFETEDEARKHYDILKKCADSMKKRKVDYDPCIFPWYKVTLTKSDFASRMAVIAYSLADDSLIDDACGRISDVDGEYSERSDILRMLLHDPHTIVQRKALLNGIADKAEYSRTTAYSIANKMELSLEDYKIIEGFLKYKTEDIRNNVIALIKKQDDAALFESAKRLVSSDKDIIRLAGFDIIKTEMQEKPDKKDSYKNIVKGIDESCLTEQEKVLYREIVKEDEEEGSSSETGYGLYTESSIYKPPVMTADLNKIKNYFSVKKEELDKILDKLEEVFQANGNREYKSCGGETQLLSNGLYLTNYNYREPIHMRYPFVELWEKFYEENVKSEQVFWNLYIALEKGYDETIIEESETYLAAEQEIFPYCGTDYKYSSKHHGTGKYGRSDFRTVMSIILSLKNFSFPVDIARECCIYAANLDDGFKWYTEHIEKPTNSFMTVRTPSVKFFVNTDKFKMIVHSLYKWNDDEEYKKNFNVYKLLDDSYEFQTRKECPSYSRPVQENYISVLMFIKACECGLVSEDMVYKYMLTELPLTVSVEDISVFNKKKLNYIDIQNLRFFVKCDEEKHTCDTDSAFFKLGKKICDEITKLILSVELKRGDTETVFSRASLKMKTVYGIDTLFDILTALGKDTLDRSTYYYYSSGSGKKQCLSHLLQISYPSDNDTVEAFAAKVKEKKIPEDRIIEVAMYAPQWLDIIEKYLGCDGFKSSCYYFMAHMNEHFDERRKAMIAKYTPLTAEELNEGAFDVDWFNEAYNKLGDKMFQKLYKAAKYISDGSKHARARKYADAAIGIVNRDELEPVIADKRNKDLLMSYGIIPIKDEADQLHRYEYIQKFLKESKQFGGQRRASEAKACEMALKNMATVAGYSDSLRLVLAMETAIVLSNQTYFDGITVGEYTFSVEVSEDGKAEMRIEKGGKTVKSVPAALKKDETVLEIKEFITKLKDQYSRSVRMFENAMEEREKYTVAEITKLCKNPVIASILENLVYIAEDDRLYLLSELSDRNGDLKVKVAHPYDLYKSGEWSKWQQIFFDRANSDNKKQPFKQVFRELYVKLPEENDQYNSRMFAGNQIQPKKTLAVLKSRRWIADYDNGLQKIYYKDNIIATIYALADWFSPADNEEPTLEYVTFYDRKTFRELKISEIPEIIYSEVMRDVDLAVSVAHAGGVDPETSHSTIQMRAVIVKFNVQLFKLTNVKIEGTHALIEGKYGNYSVHLGSGVIHKVGSHMINILPVHSQNRGKIFLPFLDEDPKTAEIISKIILLAEDDKIKDPYIMEQINY